MNTTTNRIASFFSISFRLALSCACTFILFVSLPLIYQLMGSELFKDAPVTQSAPAVMKFETQKPQKKKVQEIKPRAAKSESGVERARAFTMKFSPDLNVGTSDGVAVEESNLETVVFEEGEADVSAIPVLRAPIPFPPRARDAGIGGVVEMIILVDRKGNVASVEFTKVPSPLFKKPVEEVVRTWKFKPAMNKGVPVNMRLRQSIEFKMDD
jgi:protein TonB